MSGKQAKRYRALEGRVELLESHLVKSWMRCGTAESDAEEARRSAQYARRREREGRRREYVWRTVALTAVVAAILATLVAAVLLSVMRDAKAQETGPAAVVCRWIGGERECVQE